MICLSGNNGYNRRNGLPSVPGIPSQQNKSQGSGIINTMPQQQSQQQQANVSQNAQGFASTTNLNVSSYGYPVQGYHQGNMPVMQGQGPVWLNVQWIPQEKMFI